MASNDIVEKQRGVASVVSDICRALVGCAPDYSEVCESLAPVVYTADELLDSHELLDWMVNNSRARVTPDALIES